MQDARSILPSEMIVSKAGASHIPSILRLAEEADLSPWSKDDYLREARRQDSIFLVVESLSGGVIGFIVGRMVPGDDSNELLLSEIYNFAVATDFRKLGVGSKLLESFKQISKGYGVRKVLLDVRRTNRAARNFYVSRGFETSGERKDFYRDPADDAILMESVI